MGHAPAPVSLSWQLQALMLVAENAVRPRAVVVTGQIPGTTEPPESESPPTESENLHCSELPG